MRGESPSQTAEVVALMRAMEQRRPSAERIVDDPLARNFLGPALWAALVAWERSGRMGDLAQRLATGLTAFVQARHRHMDEVLLSALDRKRGRPRQVLLLGAGYDTRAYRHASHLRGAAFFEVDHPATWRRKLQVVEGLRKRGVLTAPEPCRIPVDFQTQDLAEALVEAGFVAGRRTFFIWEGVSMYLAREAVEGTLGTMRRLGGKGSELVADCWCLPDKPDLRSAVRRLSASLLSLLGEPLLFSIHPEDVGAFLARQGFELVDTVLPERLGSLYVPDGVPVYPACFLVHARIP